MADIRRRPEVVERGLAQWDPFKLMEAMTSGWSPLRDLERLVGPQVTGVGIVPSFDVKETKDAYVFKADLPGMRDEDIDISVTGHRLTVSGKREAEETHEDERYFTCERSYGSFNRTFTLPEGTDVDNVHAELKNGELTLMVPKKAEVQSKRISLKGVKEKLSEKLSEKGKEAKA